MMRTGRIAHFVGGALVLLALASAAPASAGTITVANTNDAGPGSLRQAIEEAAPGDTISLPASAAHYAATSTELTIEKDLTISGAGARSTIIDAMREGHRVFDITGGTVAISGVTVTGGALGGIVLEGSTSLTLSNVAVSGNGTEGNFDDGGGIESRSGTELTVDASTIAHNFGYNGGGIDARGASAITDSTIADNLAGNEEANGEGGGIEGNSEPLTLVNDTIAGNECFNGVGCGGGIDTDATAKNTIIAENLAGEAGSEVVVGEDCESTITDTGPNLESGSDCKFAGHDGGISNANPLLTSLSDNGGPTETMALEPGSPAIDHGTNEGCPETDQRGAPRPQPPGGTCDIGAVEFGALADLGVSQAASPSPATVGQTLTYTVSVSNHGPGPDAAGAATLVDTLPAGASLVSTGPSQGSCSGTTVVTCSLGSLAGGGSATVTLAVRPSSVGTATNTATISSTASDPNPANNTSQLQTSVLEPPAPPTPSPTVTGLRESAKTWHEGRAPAEISASHHKRPPLGTTFSFTLNETAAVTFTFTRRAGGRKVGKSCLAQTKHNEHKRRCTRMLTAGTFKFSAHAGLNKVRFEGVISKHLKLKPGSYKLVVSAVAAGKHSANASVDFTIVKG